MKKIILVIVLGVMAGGCAGEFSSDEFSGDLDTQEAVKSPELEHSQMMINSIRRSQETVKSLGKEIDGLGLKLEKLNAQEISVLKKFTDPELNLYAGISDSFYGRSGANRIIDLRALRAGIAEPHNTELIAILAVRDGILKEYFKTYATYEAELSHLEAKKTRAKEYLAYLERDTAPAISSAPLILPAPATSYTPSYNYYDNRNYNTDPGTSSAQKNYWQERAAQQQYWNNYRRSIAPELLPIHK